MCDMDNLRKLAKQHADSSVIEVAKEANEEDETRYFVGIESLGHLTAAEISPELAKKTIGDVLDCIFEMDWKSEDDIITIERAKAFSGSVYGNVVKMCANDYKDPKKWETFSDAVCQDKINDYFIEFSENGDKIKYACMRFD